MDNSIITPAYILITKMCDQIKSPDDRMAFLSVSTKFVLLDVSVIRSCELSHVDWRHCIACVRIALLNSYGGWATSF